MAAGIPTSALRLLFRTSCGAVF